MAGFAVTKRGLEPDATGAQPGQLPANAERNTNKDQPSGYAGLDASGLLKVPQLPPVVVKDTSGTSPASGTQGLEVVREAPLNLMDPRWGGGAGNGGNGVSTTADTAALNAAIATISASAQKTARIYLPAGAGYTFDNVQLLASGNVGDLEVFGDGYGTKLWPGSSGQIMTAQGMQRSGFHLSKVHIGASFGGTTPDYDPSKPLIQIGGPSAGQGCTESGIERVTGVLSGKGTLIMFQQAYVGELVKSCNFATGQQATAVICKVALGPNDTIAFRDNNCTGAFPFVLLNGGGAAGLNQVLLANNKVNALGGHGVGNNLEDTLVGTAAAGDTTLNVATPGSWNPGDTLFLESTNEDAEIVQVTSTNSGAGPLTIAAGTATGGLQFNHTGTNIQCLRGGIGVHLAPNIGLVKIDDHHFEGLSWGVHAGSGINSLALDQIGASVHRILRIRDFVTNLRIGAVKMNGSSANQTENILIDIPSFANANPIQGTFISREQQWNSSGAITSQVRKGGANTNISALLDVCKAQAVKAGVPSDADFLVPTDGTRVTDTTNNRAYIRTGGAWILASKQDRIAALLLAPNNYVRGPGDYRFGFNSNFTIPSGQNVACNVPVLAGEVFGSFQYQVTTGVVLGTNNDYAIVFCVWDQSGTLLAQSLLFTAGGTPIGTRLNGGGALAQLTASWTAPSDMIVRVGLMQYLGTGGAPAGAHISSGAGISTQLDGMLPPGVQGTSGLTTGPVAFGAASNIAGGVNPWIALVG